MPRFSIIITCYNQSSLIKEAVGSALAQAYPDKEVIVVDDCSTDDSGKILKEYGDAIRFKALETNQGACAARNCGASIATGDFLVFLDGDDVLLPWALKVYARIVELKDPKLILGSMIWFREAFAAIDLGHAQKELAIVDYESYMKKDRAWRASASALVIDRQCFHEAGGWTVSFFPMEDIDLVLKLGYSGRTIQILSPQTTAYRMHASNSIHQVYRLFDATMTLISKERAGKYPGGDSCRLERYAIVGGVAYYWFTRAFNMKLYRQAFMLMSSAYPMVLTALFRRAAAVLAVKRPIEKFGIISCV